MSIEETRIDPPLTADERTSLRTWLDFHRSTLLQKCQGLTGAQLAQASVPPSELTLLGLVQHMTLVEWWWFEHNFAGGDMAAPVDTSEDPDFEFHHVVPEEADAAMEAFVHMCAHSRDIEAAAATLDALSVSPERETRDLRWVMVHMIEEYARHNGHADLLRECIDGVVGD
jgi:hypothetical protein